MTHFRNPEAPGRPKAARAAVASAQVEGAERTARALDALCGAVLDSTDLTQLAARLLDVFMELAHADAGMLCVREGDELRSRAAVGIDAATSAAFSLRADAAFDATVIADALHLSGALSDPETARCCLALGAADTTTPLGFVWLAASEGRELAGGDDRLLDLLTARAAKALERQLQHESLEQAVASRDGVLAVVAHDLRNPINVISLATNVLLQRVSDSTLRRPVERIARGVQRADRLIQDLLEISAIEGGRFSIERQPVEIANVILTALESQQTLAAQASIILMTDLSPALPTIDGDAERLLEVLENLIGNSVKFTNASGSVTVGASRRDGEVLVWVKDNGCGIAPEQEPYLFDRFWQARRTDRRGTGLGLTICKAIVEAHGGRIWTESSVGVGTTMFFTIPAALVRPRAPDVSERWNILIVDDRPENLMSLEAILDRPDYRLVTATSGEEALRLALREHFEVALIDIAMPRMNGLEVAVHLKELERSRDIPIIFITAFGDDPDEIHRAYSAGGADYLVKPLDAEIVRKKVAVFIDLTRKRNDSSSRDRDRPVDP